jgi:hypothetical protein
MADFDDLSLVRGPEPQFEPPARTGPSFTTITVAALVCLAAAAVYYYYARQKPAPTAAAKSAVAQTTVDLPRRTAEPGEAIDLPPLDQTDAIVRTLAQKLSSHPVAAAYLTTNGILRNMTVVVTNIADGDTPAKHLRPLRPSGAFAVKSSGGATVIDPASYHRYDAIAIAVDALDARAVARFYATVKPRIDDAYRELIGPDANFDRTLERAIVMLLRTPILDENVRLQTSKVSYTYADPAIEDLPKVQRQFLRMGPQNVRIVKAKIRDVAGFLGLPESSLPPPDRPR